MVRALINGTYDSIMWEVSRYGSYLLIYEESLEDIFLQVAPEKLLSDVRTTDIMWLFFSDSISFRIFFCKLYLTQERERESEREREREREKERESYRALHCASKHL